MRLDRAVVPALTLALCLPAHAGAQPRDWPRSGAEVAAGVDTFAVWFPDGGVLTIPTTDLRLTLPRNPLWATEGVLQMKPGERYGLYAIQFKRRLIRFDRSDSTRFIVFGFTGAFGRGRILAPVAPLIGVGYERRVAQHVAVRIDGQVFALVGRLSLTLAVPLSRH